jgi:hypothetical protein
MLDISDHRAGFKHAQAFIDGVCEGLVKDMDVDDATKSK